MAQSALRQLPLYFQVPLAADRHVDRACETSVTFLAPSATGTSGAAKAYVPAAPDVFSLLPPPALCHHRHSFAFNLSGFNIFNFPQHSEVLKHRFEAVKGKKSVLEFQREYLEFEFEYGEFLGKNKPVFSFIPAGKH